jgi:hypothetical protein
MCAIASKSHAIDIVPERQVLKGVVVLRVADHGFRGPKGLVRAFTERN